MVEEFHGAVTRVPSTATAYPHREPGFNLFLISQWSDPRRTNAGIAWARETFDALAPYMADRSYTNYLPADDYDRVRQAFGPNYERLAALKRRYDPDNLPPKPQHRPHGPMTAPPIRGESGHSSSCAGSRRRWRPSPPTFASPIRSVLA